jgi:hypothetical protein
MSMADTGFTYKHRQTGWLVIVALAVPAVSVFFLTGRRPLVGIVVAIAFAILLLLFHSLTVTVNGGLIRIAFGVGLVRTSVPLASVRGCRQVRSPWYYGWGIHWFSGGVIYNISGFDGVELDLENGRRFRIGSDEADRLEMAITTALGQR